MTYRIHQPNYETPLVKFLYVLATPPGLIVVGIAYGWLLDCWQ